MVTSREHHLLQIAEDLRTGYERRWGQLMRLARVAGAARTNWERSENLAGIMPFDHYKMLARKAEQAMDEQIHAKQEYRREADEADVQAGVVIADNLDEYRAIAANMAQAAGVEITLVDGE